MKKIVEETGCDLAALLGEKVLVFCANYIYSGKLTGVSDSTLVIEQPHIVYETGSFSDPGYKDAQPLPAKIWYVNRGLVESLGVGK